MTLPEVSVVMPVYNGEAHIEEAVNSILRQTFRNFECVIVDDGSGDRTAEILAGLANRDARIRVLQQERKGIVAALNLGIGQSAGAYLARMDADDIADPSRLEIQVARMAGNRRLVACGSDFVKFGASTRYVATPRSDRDCKSLLAIESCFAHPTVMLRASVLREQNLTYRDESEYAEDYRLWTELAPFGEFENIARPLLRYRVHGNQVSGTRLSSQRDRHIRISASVLRQSGCDVDEQRLREFMWPSGTGMTRATGYLLQSRAVADAIRANVPDCTWLNVRMRRIRLRNLVKMASGVPV